LDADGVWFHVCSLGEARAVYPLAKQLPRTLLRFTAITQTGYDAVSNLSHSQNRFLPFDLFLHLWIRPQKVLIVMEAELWYLLFLISHKKGAKTIVLNARISDRSTKRYRRFSWIYRQIFKYVDEIYAQTETDRKRLVELGADNIVVTGNIKLFQPPKATRQLQKKLPILICAASTHEGEEALIMESFLPLKNEVPGAQLVLVPRHPERFSELISQTAAFTALHGLSLGLYSEGGLSDADIIIVDLLGELVNIYAVSDLVVMGGTFVHVGGHNVAEAAQFGCKIISGESYFNQVDIYHAVEGIRVVSGNMLAKTMQNFAKLPETKIKVNCNMEPILYSIHSVLKEEKDGTSL